uniref:Tyrosine-protein phosphatase domain-containing protein n=1 Tax=Capitella teleta TaxID=283909 RepID=X1ZRG5_CAPTE
MRPLSILSKQDQNLQVLLAPAIAMTPTLEEWGRSVNTAMIAGVTVGLLVIIAAICVAGIMFIRRRNPSSFSKENSEAQIVDEGGRCIEAGVQQSFKSKPKVEAREPVKTEDEGTKLSLRQLERYITKTNDVPDGFKDEYKKLPKPGIGECKVGSIPENRTKNRFGNIKPFDANRVLLDADDMSQSDYVNASYITGYKDVQRHYIATQGFTTLN